MASQSLLLQVEATSDNTFPNVFQVVWQNSVFHYTALVLLLVAVAIEVYSVYSYRQEVRRSIGSALRHLETNGLKTHYQNAIAPEEASWLENHLKRNAEGVYQQQNGRYILQTYPGILSRAVPRSRVRFVPTILTAVGVLGTFYGIQIGLRDISPDLHDSQALLTSSQTLFAGMRTAFSTSLMGLGSSSLLTLILAGTELQRQNYRDRLRKRLEAITVLETADVSLANAADQLASFNPQVLGQQIGEQVGEQIGEQIGQKVGEQISTHLNQAIVSQLVPVFQDISISLQTLRQIKANQGQDALENLVQSLQTDVLEPVTDRLNQSADLTRQVSETVQSFHQELSGITHHLAASVQTIQTFQQDTVNKLHEFSYALSQTFYQFPTVAQEASQLMERSKEQFVASLQQVDDMLQQSSQQVNSSMKTIQETAEAVSKLALADHLSWGARLGELQEAARGIGDELQRVEKAHRQMHIGYQQMNEQTQLNYENALSSWRSELKEHLQQVSRAQKQFFADADQSMAIVSSKFLETVQVLVELEQSRGGGDRGQNGSV